ncbi:MAG: hypothetical protein MPI95_01950 [Nitrosopumilus sp.]|nr:hypothetical protein [Nitrosopumilus sp.]CAI9831215.1 conserved hypothetical protein [Nitrosopumilaceae archaeon]MDA7940756.1 hypothetical protein [Nitrosopumilus sp.]MDA7942964.1 hypothetical protein [Nitrosopumilus sp.]MDA7944625.1 hypothetical protein [Nitrosopumilus sp.]
MLALTGACAAVLLAAYPGGTCGIEGILISGSADGHESLDPEDCYLLDERIADFNGRCGDRIEHVDCG